MFSKALVGLETGEGEWSWGCQGGRWGGLDRLDTRVEEFKESYRYLYERDYGSLRPVVDKTVDRFSECGMFRRGFARIRCPECREEPKGDLWSGRLLYNTVEDELLHTATSLETPLAQDF